MKILDSWQIGIITIFFFLGRIDTIAILLKALKMWILAKALLFRRTIRLSAAKRKFWEYRGENDKKKPDCLVSV